MTTIIKRGILSIWYVIADAVAQLAEKPASEPEPRGIALVREARKKARLEPGLELMHLNNALFAAKREGVEAQFKAELRKLGIDSF